ncbi:MAG: hypothetical protein JWP78_1881 [Mucilaginibacter sp.]|nr:hypothetical protein [Mucilaginibacter sp.]
MFNIVIRIGLLRKPLFFVIVILYLINLPAFGLTYLSDKAVKTYYYYILKRDIESSEDVSLLAESFYPKVVGDRLLGFIFTETLFF